MYTSDLVCEFATDGLLITNNKQKNYYLQNNKLAHWIRQFTIKYLFKLHLKWLNVCHILVAYYL